MEEFAERLKELREEHNISICQLAKEIGVSDIAIGRWERKQRIPNIVCLKKLALFFKVTSDYLLGLED